MSEASVWNRLAGRYDTVVRLFDTSYPAVEERIERDITRGARVLELAAGTGQFTPTLARIAGALTATDISLEMVDRLRALVDREELGDVDARVMSAYGIEAPDGVFDAVFCANALHVMDEPARALGEIYRVLRPGGVLVAPTFLHGTGPGRRLLSRAMSVVSPFVARTRFDLSALGALVRGAGFEIERSEQLPGMFPLGYVTARRPAG